MDGELPVQRRVFSSEIDNYFVGGFAQPTPTNDRDETTVSLHEQATLKAFNVPIRLHIGKLG